MSSLFEALRIVDFDHLEFAVGDLDKSLEVFLRMGFEKIATRELLQRKLKSHLLIQNSLRVLLSSSEDPEDRVARYVAAHGDGCLDVAFRAEDAMTAFEAAVNRGAVVASHPKALTKDFGTVEQASIKAFGEVTHSFLTRKGNLFAEGFEAPLKIQTRGYGLQRVDHIGITVEPEQLTTTMTFYETVFGLTRAKEYTVRDTVVGGVMKSPGGLVKFLFNEPKIVGSTTEEFIEVHHGSGIQHIAFGADDILTTIPPLKKQGVKFVQTPSPYYEQLASRFPKVTESPFLLQQLGLQVDGDASGYLLQIFTQKAVGPLFFEVLQRKNFEGFGEANAQALEQALRQDQVKKGVIQ